MFTGESLNTFQPAAIHHGLVNVHVHARVRYSPARRMQFVQAALDLLHDPLVAVLASVTYPS